MSPISRFRMSIKFCPQLHHRDTPLVRYYGRGQPATTAVNSTEIIRGSGEQPRRSLTTPGTTVDAQAIHNLGAGAQADVRGGIQVLLRREAPVGARGLGQLPWPSLLLRLPLRRRLLLRRLRLLLGCGLLRARCVPDNILQSAAPDRKRDGAELSHTPRRSKPKAKRPGGSPSRSGRAPKHQPHQRSSACCSPRGRPGSRIGEAAHPKYRSVAPFASAGA